LFFFLVCFFDLLLPSQNFTLAIVFDRVSKSKKRNKVIMYGLVFEILEEFVIESKAVMFGMPSRRKPVVMRKTRASCDAATTLMRRLLF
jgi:hypothetical protein